MLVYHIYRPPPTPSSSPAPLTVSRRGCFSPSLLFLLPLPSLSILHLFFSAQCLLVFLLSLLFFLSFVLSFFMVGTFYVLNQLVVKTNSYTLQCLW